MVNYRRNYSPGGTYFFTLTLKNRDNNFLTTYFSLLQAAYSQMKSKYPFNNIASVVLPEHMHMIWKLPEGHTDYISRIKIFKSLFTKRLVAAGIPASKNLNDEYDLWQPRYWEHTIKHEDDLQTHVDYIHYNPVKHHYVQQVKQWPFSTFHEYVKRGVLSEDWSGKSVIKGKRFGE